MNTKPECIAATYYPSTHPGLMTCVFLIVMEVLIFVFLTFRESITEPWIAWFACGLFFFAAMFNAMKWAHSVRFSPEGVLFYRFGKQYRLLPWNQVVQVGVVKEYKASRLSLAITPDGCPRFDTANRNTTGYVEQYRHKLVILDATKENIASIRKLYGELDYIAKTYRKV